MTIRRKKKVLQQSDCESIFDEFLKKKLSTLKTSSFTFVPRDVLDYENMHEKRYSTKIKQSEMKIMGLYITGLEGTEVIIEDLCTFIITLHRYKDRSSKVYKLEVIE